ncbi:DUF998 domain-containing protein [Streptomyces sp. MB09-01]|uniref:DUF998 domain-containing protein n=1 Tax=Streptomyces sp. MB09-01 TaxID=3028666 RepID=UPI0029BA9797|nr:DUF998 domain-containing protein [Streptomyces sp. MB09-01]MDX3533014.1 DUF998 domain-containing protein [Streptomyces sp. MB09-01]
MPHTLSALPHPAPTAPASRRGRTALVGGMAAGPLFLGAAIVQSFARDGFDFGRNAISQLALGESGWVQTVNFSLAGALLIAGAAGLRRVVGGDAGGTWGPVLVGVFGISFWAAAAFPADAGAGFPVGAPGTTVMSGHGAAHMAAGMVGYLALCAAFVVLSRPLATRGHRSWAVASRLVPVAVLVGFMASAASVLAFTAGAGLGLLWLTAVTARLAMPPAPPRAA